MMQEAYVDCNGSLLTCVLHWGLHSCHANNSPPPSFLFLHTHVLLYYISPSVCVSLPQTVFKGLKSAEIITAHQHNSINNNNFEKCISTWQGGGNGDLESLW